MCRGGEERADPDAKGDHRALRARNADPLRKHVIPRSLDAPQDGEVDPAHDLRRDQAARVTAGKVRGGTPVVVASALALEPDQLADRGGHVSLAQHLFRHAETFQIFKRQVEPPLAEIGSDIAHDVRQLQGEPEVDGVGARRRVAIAKDLDADQSHRRRDPAAVFGQRVEGGKARVIEVHLDAANEVIERLARQAEFPDVGLECHPLRSAGRTGLIAGGHLRPPQRQLLLFLPPRSRLIHRIVNRAAEVPYGDDRAPLPRRQHEKRVVEVGVPAHASRRPDGLRLPVVQVISFHANQGASRGPIVGR